MHQLVVDAVYTISTLNKTTIDDDLDLDRDLIDTDDGMLCKGFRAGH